MTPRPLDPAVEAAARGQFVKVQKTRKPRKKKRRTKNRIRAPPSSDVAAYSIFQFCRIHGNMSEALFHKLKKLGLGPKVMDVGGRTLISIEAAAEWRRQREQAVEQGEHAHEPACV
jgi:hypothetical protein